MWPARSHRSGVVPLGKNGPFPSKNPSLEDQRETDFQAVGNSLKAGDLRGARQSVQNLIQDFHPTLVANPRRNGGPRTAAPIPTPVRAMDLVGQAFLRP